ncbi:tRNA (adenosine(37)-N6)-threonylcarbamoyltransferase complex dimerization subunit type 1 TsaB [Neisseria chenwenguii]|uniref:tRNA (Adenosine(37)-N6)-threonylcarbamoyltransferase complex dimerization subunit type 1 TsaB n=1 Tax=Neisseria chenwenguii TaxID=1853278 RepID=A0A220S4L5_9NEIS|nr:tRNA (adenosine(37)-N6)-threonylcarbamoyltransferase complex dimerization subunit type 1 TsaB [Neisseria chenwenguii]ASK28459.1 tRNA (adenosine(37)-N6)-threonylcarbamoyltransferase complex dimerization subunit type 1 TsaB [Neisseria chenwenguii]ROV54912.1 tRNA (adenosine(37)-N6)-threonylcarbamoyltransferase complex dimerization subunit type 1 TsaB [Neisseria chenwenguii]
MNADFRRPTLAVDTSTSYLSLALSAGGETRLCHLEAGNKQSELILPQIRALFAEADITAADLGAVVYAQGPGAFTGLRIGAGVAQGLAAPFAVPLVGVPCLDAAAHLVPGRSGVLAAIDARMGEVFYAWFDTANHRRLSAYQVGKAAEITLPEGAEFSDGIGNAFALSEPPPFAGKPDMPTAADYLNLAQTGRYPAVGAAQAGLLYVRDKIALTAAEQAARKATS